MERLIVFLLSLAAGGRTEGVDVELGAFFDMARASRLWPGAWAAHRSAVTRARAKVPWDVFRALFKEAATLALELWPERPGECWRGMRVLAIDGSKFRLPASAALRQAFDPTSGLQNPGKGHYPQCLVSTLYDVLRGLPLARAVAPFTSCERNEALKLMRHAPQDSLVIFDRGYPAYRVFLSLRETFAGHFLMRCPATSTFPALVAFLASGKQEALIEIAPSWAYRHSVPAHERKSLPTISLRAIRTIAPDGELVVFLTSLLDIAGFQRQDIIDLYRKRWEIEVYYREEKVVQDVERFHSRTVNGVLQELYAAPILTVIARTMSALSEEERGLPAHAIQRKNAVIALARWAALLVPLHPRLALHLFEDLLSEMARVRYHRPKCPRPSQPRVSKTPRNKWRENLGKSKSP